MKTKNFITSDDPSGLDAIAKWCAVYNKQNLTDGADGSAQRLNRSCGFWKELAVLIKKHSANDVVSSEYTPTYPKEYEMKPIEEQVKLIAEKFRLNPTQALEFAKNLPAFDTFVPSDCPDIGWFAIPKVSAVVQKHFPEIVNYDEQYCEVLKLVHRKIAESRSFKNFCEGQITTAHIRQVSRTRSFFKQIEYEQKGDILILAVQYGLRYRGESAHCAIKTFSLNEFGLDSFAVGCMALVHPKRYAHFGELDTACPGDEFTHIIDRAFSGVPIWRFYDGELRFGTFDVSDASVIYGSVSAFFFPNN